jgi:hypothetical protein
MRSVEKLGVRKRGCTRPKAAGMEFHLAMDSVVRAVGRIVVWVEAEAEVRTQMTSSLSSPDPKTPLPRAFRTSLGLEPRKCVPWKAYAAALTET